ncbi:OLC1v1013330C1 [Oldenlandia corymbosa var. corymbosa]|uniref:OLC1v1013330C1 n=1 Tax=Oldenlandia corymbosa var. corymbosa TaxID=529605 RepID=A0AAV1DY21_OLDCO|nr:OLC1v1013330C1 [Oldenlandia corymbosa var. corymbosa]
MYNQSIHYLYKYLYRKHMLCTISTRNSLFLSLQKSVKPNFLFAMAGSPTAIPVASDPPQQGLPAVIPVTSQPQQQAAQRYIADINGLISTKSKHFFIVVRVMSMWKMMDTSKKGEVKSLELTLIDAEGSKIQATIPARFMRDFKDWFEEGCCRKISCFDHALNINGAYRCAKHEYKIVFEPNTLVQTFVDFDIPNHIFEFTPFAEINNFVANFDYCFDVIGHIIGYSDPIVDAQKKRISVQLEDEKADSMKVTIWGEHADLITNYLSKELEFPVVLIVQIYLDDMNIPAIYEYKHRLEQNDIKESSIHKISIMSSISGYTTFEDFVKDSEILTLNEIRDLEEFGPYMGHPGYGTSNAKSYNPGVFLNEKSLLTRDSGMVEDRAFHVLEEMVLSFNEGEDKLIWKPTPLGVFTIKSEYEALRRRQVENPSLRNVWHKFIPLRISFFMWKFGNSLLPFTENLCRMGIYLQPSICWKCKSSSDSMRQQFLECAFARQVWNFFAELFGQVAHGSSLGEYLNSWWISGNFKTAIGVIKKVLPSFIVWELWKARNKFFFENVDSNFSGVIKAVKEHLHGMMLVHRLKARNVVERESLQLIFPNTPFSLKQKKVRKVSWQRQRKHVLNTDGSSNSQAAGYGFVIRGEKGFFLYEEAGFLGSGDSLQAEVYGLLFGVRKCEHLDLFQVEVQTDNQFLANILASGGPCPRRFYFELREIRAILVRRDYSIHHIYREANAVADSLARCASDEVSAEFFSLGDLPNFTRGLITLDQQSMPYGGEMRLAASVMLRGQEDDDELVSEASVAWSWEEKQGGEGSGRKRERWRGGRDGGCVDEKKICSGGVAAGFYGS